MQLARLWCVRGGCYKQNARAVGGGPGVSGFEDIVRSLLTHGADPRAKNRRGETPLMKAHEWELDFRWLPPLPPPGSYFLL